MADLRKALLLALALALFGCSNGNSIAKPISGIYVSDSGEQYRVNTEGSSALSVTWSDNCTQFWRSKRPKIVNGIEQLRGQSCSNSEFGSLDWTALYDSNQPQELKLIAPDGATHKLALEMEGLP